MCRSCCRIGRVPSRPPTVERNVAVQLGLHPAEFVRHFRQGLHKGLGPAKVLMLEPSSDELLLSFVSVHRVSTETLVYLGEVSEYVGVRTFCVSSPRSPRRCYARRRHTAATISRQMEDATSTVAWLPIGHSLCSLPLSFDASTVLLIQVHCARIPGTLAALTKTQQSKTDGCWAIAREAPGRAEESIVI